MPTFDDFTVRSARFKNAANNPNRAKADVPGTPVLALFRRSKKYKRIRRGQKDLSHLVASKKQKKANMTDRAESMIDHYLAGSDIKSILEFDVEPEQLNQIVHSDPAISKFADSVITCMIDKGLDQDLIEVKETKNSVIIYLSRGIVANESDVPRLLSEVGRVEKIADPEDDEVLGAFVYEIFPPEGSSKDFGGYVGDTANAADPTAMESCFITDDTLRNPPANSVGPQKKGRDKKGRQILYDKSIKFEDDYSVGTKVETPRGAGKVIKVQDFGTPEEKYVVEYKDSTRALYYKEKVWPLTRREEARYTIKRFVIANQARLKAQQNKDKGTKKKAFRVLGKLMQAKPKADESVLDVKLPVLQEQDNNPRPKKDDLYIDSRNKEPFRVIELIGNRVKVKGLQPQDIEQVIPVSDIERAVTTGQMTKLNESDSYIGFIDICPNCMISLEEGAAGYKCSRCEYSVELETV